MKLVEWLQRVMVSTGSVWVMWLLIGLSVISVAIILERAWFFFSLRDDIGGLARDLTRSLDSGIEAARKRMQSSPSAEAAVVLAGLDMAHRGPDAAEEAMNGATAIQRMKLEKRLVYLGTLGNNAPFIGLFGTVIGVLMAFDKLGGKNVTAEAAQAAGEVTKSAIERVSGSIAEALVATAVGIAVAIPAVAFNNLFQRLTKATLANTEALSRTLLAYLKTDVAYVVPAGVAAEPAPARVASKGPANKKVEPKKDDADEEES